MASTIKPMVSVEEVESDDSVEEVVSDDSVEADSGSDAEPGDDLDIEIKEEKEDDEGELSQSFEVDDSIVEVKEEEERKIKESDVDEEEDEEVVTSDEYDSDDIKSEGESDSENEDTEIESEEDSETRNDAAPKQRIEKKVRLDVEDDSDIHESESSDDDEAEDSKDKIDSDVEDSKSGLANVMARILAKSDSDDLMLSKAKKDYMVKKEEETGTEFEVVDMEGNVKTEVTIKVEEDGDLLKLAHKKHLEKERLALKFKLKPDFQADREKERKLKIIATQGVVQLFTAIEKHKSIVKQHNSKTNSTFADDDFNPHDLKESFLNILDQEGQKLKRSHDDDDIKTELKHEPSAPKKPKWNVFADNFYKEPTLQGWDMKSDDED